MKKILLLIFALVSAEISAQVLYDHTPNARTAAMGGAAVATRGDAFAAFGNAASALMEYRMVQLSFGYTDFAGEQYGQNRIFSGGGYVRFASRHALILGMQFNLAPPHNYNDKRPGTQRYDLAYGCKITDRVALAATCRYYRAYGHFADEDNYNGGGADVAVFSRIPLQFMEGAALNVGGKVAFDSPYSAEYNRYSLSPSVGVALSMPFSDAHILDITTELKYGYTKQTDIFAAKLGAEYSLMRLLYLRAGGNVAHMTGNQTISYATLGAGIRFFHFQFDVAYLVGKKGTPFHNAVQLNVGLDF